MHHTCCPYPQVPIHSQERGAGQCGNSCPGSSLPMWALFFTLLSHMWAWVTDTWSPILKKKALLREAGASGSFLELLRVPLSCLGGHSLCWHATNTEGVCWVSQVGCLPASHWAPPCWTSGAVASPSSWPLSQWNSPSALVADLFRMCTSPPVLGNTFC